MLIVLDYSVLRSLSFLYLTFNTGLSNESLREITPIKAAITEVNSTAAFPSFIRVSLENAKLSIKIDIVKPIPAIIPTDKR